METGKPFVFSYRRIRLFECCDDFRIHASPVQVGGKLNPIPHPIGQPDYKFILSLW